MPLAGGVLRREVYIFIQGLVGNCFFVFFLLLAPLDEFCLSSVGSHFIDSCQCMTFFSC